MAKKNQPNASDIAGRVYNHEDSQKGDALAITHEQVMDSYMEGEIGGVMDQVAGKDIPLGQDDAE
ncbi:YozQ family protein [Neobacillus muris]|uniref:YozQ family protein n=1 Tax=Neobacillus muris TaxID=2941334 RepID=UPI002041D7B1|nr:YozQ family protein [Neobacillus muris]